jgi:tRNA(Ile)-lysidine synthetase-like protein
MDYVRTRDILRPGEKVLVGVSGGADSTALTLLLSALRMSEGFLGLRLHLVHFNHQLRTEAEAEADIDFVRTLAERVKVPISCGNGDVRSFARRKHLSIEDAARRLRYRFLAEEADACGATAVAVGHTANDQAETVLTHIVRGAGLRGLRGMAPRSPWPFGPGPDLVRPLLNMARAETEFYCRAMGIEPREDPTNLSLAHARNRIRHVILPAMREINPRVDDALVRLARSVETDVDYLEREVARVWNSLAVQEDEAVQFEFGRLRDLDRALTSRLLARAAGAVGGGEATPSEEQIGRVIALISSGKTRWSVSFSGGVTVSARSRVVRVGRRDRGVKNPQSPATFDVPGSVGWNGWRISAGPESDAGRSRSNHELVLDPAMIRGRLIVRSRQDGDRMQPVGLGGTKKVQDILVDRKVPFEERDHLPLICDDIGILWIPGHCVDERAATMSSAEGKIRIVILPLKGTSGGATIRSRARSSSGPEGPKPRGAVKVPEV